MRKKLCQSHSNMTAKILTHIQQTKSGNVKANETTYHNWLEFILGMQVWLNSIINDAIHYPTIKRRKNMIS